ncbi:hypothetical protein GCM10020331_029390 [Ectobacillus funiculus]
MEKDKEYLLKPAPTKIGDLVDFTKINEKKGEYELKTKLLLVVIWSLVLL